MLTLKHAKLLLSTLLLSTCLHAAPPPKGSKPDVNAVAESCRQAALTIDSLGRYQDRPMCTQNMDGGQAYKASKYTQMNRFVEAQALVTQSIIQISFAIDIGCYGQNELKAVLAVLQGVQTNLSVLSE
jgi:hypothetical protein